MARLKLSPAGLTSPLDVGAREAAEADDVRADLPERDAEAAPARVVSLVPAPHAPVADAAPAATAPGDASYVATYEDAPRVQPATVDPAPAPGLPDGVAVPEWAAALPADRLQPGALLGRPRQTALILDVAISERLDALAAAAGPHATVAALVTAVLHFHLPVDGAAATRAVGTYRRARLDDLDRAWDERNARLPGPVRDRLDVLVAEANLAVADVRRSTLVNALLDQHLPTDPHDAARLVTRLTMVRGGAFLR